CDNPQNDDGLLEETVIGCTRIAASSNSSILPPEGTDFQLLELNPIPTSYNVYYAGWNRNDLDNLSGPGSIIQHPLSDIKKISFVSEFSEAVSNSDLYAITMTTPSGEGGNAEPNSSGSPIFDNMKLVVATISSGQSGCVTNVDPDNIDSGVGGRFYSHWDKNGTENDRRLAPWLDPLNTGVMTLEGKNSNSVGIDELQINASLFNVIPNPANDFVTVKSDLAITKILFYSIDGKLLLTTDKSETIDISKLPIGLIIIKIYSENGKIAHSKMYKQ
ncbi:MAG: T9SS type A sorting domain-containing protein, partial [Bacteroidetes bacterium]|nr:T9SS type A sorting domain-containing protein [Bacteroidota bacterium]